jgi:hypothetical protein
LPARTGHAEADGKRLRRHQSDRVRILDWVSGEALDEPLTNAMFVVCGHSPDNQPGGITFRRFLYYNQSGVAE